MSRRIDSDGQAVKLLEIPSGLSNSGDASKHGNIYLKKMRNFVKCMDVDKDGYFTMKDFELLSERYMKLGKLDPYRAEQGMKQLKLAWDTVFAPAAVDGKLSPELMVQSILTRNRDLIVALAAICFYFIYDMIDAEGKGAISREEFRVYHRMVNINDDNVTDKVFDTMDVDKNGSLSILEFIQAGIDYFLSNDENSPYNLLYGLLPQ